MKVYLRWLLVWALNSLLFILANNYYPRFFVLGNAVMTPTMAAVLSGFLLTIFLKLMKNFSSRIGKNRYRMFVYYFLANSVGIWIIARLSVITGFGIPAFYYAFFLGFFASIAQWLLRQVFKKAKLQ